MQPYMNLSGDSGVLEYKNQLTSSSFGFVRVICMCTHPRELAAITSNR